LSGLAADAVAAATVATSRRHTSEHTIRQPIRSNTIVYNALEKAIPSKADNLHIPTILQVVSALPTTLLTEAVSLLQSQPKLQSKLNSEWRSMCRCHTLTLNTQRSQRRIYQGKLDEV
jgi:hypothetical protein